MIKLAHFYRTDPATDSHQPWLYGLVTVDHHDEIAEVETFLAEHRDVNVLGQLLALDALTPEEQEELRVAAEAFDEEALARLLPRVPRVSTPGVDLDFDDAAASARLRVLFDGFWRRRGVTLRWACSSGPDRFRLHGELAPAEPGAEHPELMRAAFGLWRQACREAGLVERADHQAAGDFWVFPGDPNGAVGTIDLSPLNRRPEARGSLFRPLGGLTKDRRARKVLAPGSSERGSPWTRELVEEGLRAWRAQEEAAGRNRKGRRKQIAREPLEDLPQAHQLPRVTAWVHAQARPNENHDLRMSFAATMRLAGVARPEHVIEALARGTGNRMDARDAWDSSDQRVRAGLPVKAHRALRARVGVAGLEELAWAMSEDHRERGSRGDYMELVRRLGVLRPPEPVHLEHARLAIQARLDQDDPERAKLEALRARVEAVRRCLSWSGEMEPDECGKAGRRTPLHCGLVDACPRCAWRYASGVVEALQLPERVDLAAAPYPTRKAAKAAVASAFRRCNVGEARPTGLTAPDGKGGWVAVAFAPSGTYAARAVLGVIDLLRGRGQIPTDSLHVEHAPSALAKAWVGRVLLMRHVAGRALLERGDAAGFVELAVSLYRRKAVQTPRGGATAIEWPSTEAVKAVRQRWAQAKREREGDDSERYCQCDHVPSWKRRWRVVETETGRVIVSGLRGKPTLVKAVKIAAAASRVVSSARRL